MSCMDDNMVFDKARKILVISDTHGRLGDVQRLLEKLDPPDLLLHLGDIESDPQFLREMSPCPVVCVSGNCDWIPGLPKEALIRIGKYKVWLNHGHRYGVRAGVGVLRQEAIDRGADIAMFGHTHIPVIMRGDDVTIINPGSLAFPKQEPFVPTYIMMDIDSEGTAHYTINRFE